MQICLFLPCFCPFFIHSIHSNEIARRFVVCSVVDFLLSLSVLLDLTILAGISLFRVFFQCLCVIKMCRNGYGAENCVGCILHNYPLQSLSSDRPEIIYCVFISQFKSLVLHIIVARLRLFNFRSLFFFMANCSIRTPS